MPFLSTGLPTLPTCESDIARWAAQIETYIVAKFSEAHAEIDKIVIAPYDLCAELGSLSAPTCLVPAEGVDNTGFSYAEEGDTLVAGSGVLPWPGSVITGVIEDIRTGDRQFDGLTTAWQDFTITLSPAVARDTYHVSWTLIPKSDGGISACDVAVKSRTASSFVLSVLGRVASSSAKIRWMLLLPAE